jgi:hypothetical protein
MSESPADQAFQDEVARTAGEAVEEWLGQGWTVVEPGSALDRLPESLRRLRPDYVLMKDGELVVVEAKAWKPGGMEDLDDLAKAVAELPNARLELHWLGSGVRVSSAGVIAGFASEAVKEYVKEARALLRAGHLRPALLIAWSAVEGALLYHAASLGVPLPPRATGTTLPWQVASELDSLGYLNDDDLKRLTELRSQRNTAAHFTGPTAPPSQTVIEYGLELAERMLSGRYFSVDQMVDWYENRAEEAAPPVDGEQSQIRQLLAENFPGAKSSDIDLAVARLLQDEQE